MAKYVADTRCSRGILFKILSRDVFVTSQSEEIVNELGGDRYGIEVEWSVLGKRKRPPAGKFESKVVSADMDALAYPDNTYEVSLKDILGYNQSSKATCRARGAALAEARQINVTVATAALQRGDIFSTPENELHRVIGFGTADAVTTEDTIAVGARTLQIWPRLRRPLTNNDVLNFADPTGIFLLDNEANSNPFDDISWSSEDTWWTSTAVRLKERK